MLLSAVITGAAPEWVGARLTKPTHVGKVVHAGSNAVYVSSYKDVMGVVSRHATSLPCAISTRLNTLDGSLGPGRQPTVGSDVTIGSGLIDFGGIQFSVGRYLDFSMPEFDPAAAAQMRERLEGVTREFPLRSELDPDVTSILRERPTDALMRTLGHGSGLTPFGDDVLCGVMATLLASADPCAGELCEQTVALAPGRTTSLSATLLRRAAQGEVVPAFADVVAALVDHPNQAAARVTKLLGIGHTSGAGMLLGLRLALEHRSRCS